MEQFQEYHFERVHHPGKRHTNADAMSCHPCVQCQWSESQCATCEPGMQVATTVLAPEREQSTTDIELGTAQL